MLIARSAKSDENLTKRDCLCRSSHIADQSIFSRSVISTDPLSELSFRTFRTRRSPAAYAIGDARSALKSAPPPFPRQCTRLCQSLPAHSAHGVQYTVVCSDAKTIKMMNRWSQREASARTELEADAAADVTAMFACGAISAGPIQAPVSAAGGGSCWRGGTGHPTGAASSPRGWYNWLRNAGHCASGGRARAGGSNCTLRIYKS